jgi:hypothetical protein
MLVTRTLPCVPHEPGPPETSFVYVPREPSSAGEFARRQPGHTLLPGNQTAQNCTPQARLGHIQQTKRALRHPCRAPLKENRELHRRHPRASPPNVVATWNWRGNPRGGRSDGAAARSGQRARCCRSYLDCRKREELDPTSMKEAGEEAAVQGSRRNCV